MSVTDSSMHLITSESRDRSSGKAGRRLQQEVGVREDIHGWRLGMVFIVMLLVAMFILGGKVRGWDAPSGYTHNTSLTSKDRFLCEPFIEEVGVPGRYGPDAEFRWYYWKLPPEKVTIVTRVTVWLCYASHQILIWIVLFKAQMSKMKTTKSKYSTKMESFNWYLLYLNIGFHLLHLLQSHLFYDALAQDVSVSSSQGSVTMLLIFVLLMEYKDRGLAFGWPTESNKGRISQQLRLGSGPIEFIRKYHGYGFAWAAVYTFWYHPMENTWAHVSGFINTWILMLQGSLVYTKVHLNRYWRLLLEFWVTIHSTIVAIQTGGPDLQGTKLWPMFLCGFLWLFSMTQLFGLPFWKKLPTYLRIIPFIVYLCFITWLFSWLPDEKGRAWFRLNEAVRIPTIDYIFVLFSWLVIEIFLRVQKNLPSHTKLSPNSHVLNILCIIGFLFSYVGLVAISALVQILDIQFYGIPIMIGLVMIYIVGVSMAAIFLRTIFQGVKVNIE